MVCTSTIGTFTWYWFSTVLVVETASPSTTRPARNVVPPMSVEITLRCPSSSASRVQPTTPPVSTEPMVVMARDGASAESTHPPEPCITSREPPNPRSRSSASSGRR